MLRSPSAWSALLFLAYEHQGELFIMRKNHGGEGSNSVGDLQIGGITLWGICSLPKVVPPLSVFSLLRLDGTQKGII